MRRRHGAEPAAGGTRRENTMKTAMEQLEDLREYQDYEAGFELSIAPDGCYYCGGSNPTDCCTQPECHDFYDSLR